MKYNGIVDIDRLFLLLLIDSDVYISLWFVILKCILLNSINFLNFIDDDYIWLF